MAEYLRITRVLIRNFRSIDRQEVNANWITAFVGQNDAGKSNILATLEYEVELRIKKVIRSKIVFFT